MPLSSAVHRIDVTDCVLTAHNTIVSLYYLRHRGDRLQLLGYARSDFDAKFCYRACEAISRGLSPWQKLVV